MARGSVGEKPWILVWDLDQTLVDGIGPLQIINKNAVKFLDEALKLRDAKNSVLYNFLLTNNSDPTYIAQSIKMITDNILRYAEGTTIENREYTSPDPYTGKIFDAIKYAKRKNVKSHTEIFYIPASDERYGDENNPKKSLEDIVDLILLTGTQADEGTLLDQYNIMFFDDRADHVLKDELKAPNLYKVIKAIKDNRDTREFGQQSFQPELDLLRGGVAAAGGGAAGGGAAGGAERKQVGASRYKYRKTYKRKTKAHKKTKKLTKKPRSK